MLTVLCGWLARKLGQSRVIGEIIAGILIGPSVLGRLAPTFSTHLFNQNSLSAFESISTIGLILFLFLIGMEIDYEQLRRQRSTALLVSAMSILFPLVMAGILAHALHKRFGGDSIGAWPFMLFLGISMSITAFPVLARIIEERGLQGTSLGSTAILCAAIDDLAAWILLAFALAFIGQSHGRLDLPARFAGVAAYLCLMLFGVCPLAKRLARRHQESRMSLELLGIIISALLLSAATTDAMGIHPLFGAFLAGFCFPRVPHWLLVIRSRLGTLVSVLLLPLFFALTGMRTRLDLLNGINVWFWAVVVLAAAILGKAGGAALAARWSGRTWRDAVALGTLLNTRGLVELIVLNIAYSAHVFTPTLFTMLVVMAVVTTMMTLPMLNLLGVEDESRVPLGCFPSKASTADSVSYASKLQTAIRGQSR
ncbi:MAG: potassium transporter Kef [Acidobacteria bacterium]|nr:MAG: potassium transporter Kef [Acidobacteriota bacterium]